MDRLRFYFEHSLLGYFSRRAKEKWFTSPPAQLRYHDVLLQLDRLPKEMQNVLISGIYESAEVQLLPTLISKSDRVLEIGAAIGFVGLFCRKVLGVETIVSVEPNPRTLSHLRYNYDLNGFKPAIIEAAIAPADGRLSFYVNDHFWNDSLTRHENGANSTKIEVQGLTFKSILDQAKTTFDTLIIDVEGGEQYIPVGFIPESVKKILIEIHPDVIGVRPAYSILETLIRSGFDVHGHLANCWALVRRA